nr:reverse transcriptase domain-containing protein [Tanacetum cinerariifolium]
MIAGLRIVARMRVRNMHMSVDSKLVANQVLGTYVAKEENMIKYLEKAKILISGFANFSISQVPRSKNKKADALSKIASTSFAHLSKQVLVEVLKEKSIQERKVATVVEEDGPTWMTPIKEYLKDGTLPDDIKEASNLLDRGEIRGNNHRQLGEEVRVGQHSVSLWPSGRNSLGQRVQGVTFRPRDFFYHSNDAIHVVDEGKLGPKWEGPYEWREGVAAVVWRVVAATATSVDGGDGVRWCGCGVGDVVETMTMTMAAVEGGGARCRDSGGGEMMILGGGRWPESAIGGGRHRKIKWEEMLGARVFLVVLENQVTSVNPLSFLTCQALADIGGDDCFYVGPLV